MCFFSFPFFQQNEHWKNKQTSDFEFVMKIKLISLAYFPTCGLYTLPGQHTPMKNQIKEYFKSLADFLFQMKENAQVYKKNSIP